VAAVFVKDTVEVKRGGLVYVLWASTRSTSAVNGTGSTITATGLVAIVPTSTQTYSYTFSGSGGSVTCSATLTVAEVAATGPTTLHVATVPLLSGGVAYPGTSVPVAYLQVQNAGTENALVKGITIAQRGNAHTESIIGLSVIDDKGMSVSVTGGAVSSTPFSGGTAVANMEALLLPGQRRLFTVRAIMAPALTSFRGTNLILDVTGVETNAALVAAFPIRGTVWSIQ
jgi:hypothetical protein